MREYIVCTLILLGGSAASGQTAPADWKVVKDSNWKVVKDSNWKVVKDSNWKVVKDSKGLCQIRVPPEWALMDENRGAAVLHDVSTGIAVVTAQPGQAFQPLNAMLLRVLNIPKEKMSENTVKRIFYQDKVSRNAEDANQFTASVPGSGGTCSCHVVGLPAISEEIAKTIALSLGPATEKQKT